MSISSLEASYNLELFPTSKLRLKLLFAWGFGCLNLVLQGQINSLDSYVCCFYFESEIYQVPIYVLTH